MSEYNKIDSYLEKNLDQSIAELSRLVAQPSVGAQNLGIEGMRRTRRRDAQGTRLRCRRSWIRKARRWSLANAKANLIRPC